MLHSEKHFDAFEWALSEMKWAFHMQVGLHYDIECYKNTLSTLSAKLEAMDPVFSIYLSESVF